MTNEIAIQEEGNILALPPVDQATETIYRVESAARQLADAVRSNGWFAPMGDKQYLEVEAWQFIGMVIGITLDIEYTKPVTNDGGSIVAYESKAVLYQNGVAFSSGIMECGMDTFPTRGKFGRDKDKAAQSASQTWAVSKAYRNRLGFLAKIAGYESTPADEMRWDKEPPTPQVQPSVPAQKTHVVVPSVVIEGDGKLCPVHQVEWDFRPTPDNWNKTPEGRPFQTASHPTGDGQYCNMGKVYRAEVEEYIGVDNLNSSIGNWFKTTWSKLDPDQMIQALEMAKKSSSPEKDDSVGFNILSIDDVADGGLHPLFNADGEELPTSDNAIPDNENTPF